MEKSRCFLPREPDAYFRVGLQKYVIPARLNRKLNVKVLRLTFTGGGADVVHQIHDEVQVHEVIIKAVVVEFEQLLLFKADLCGVMMNQRGFILTAHLSQRTGNETQD